MFQPHQPHQTNRNSIYASMIATTSHVALAQSQLAVIVHSPGVTQVTKPVCVTVATVKSLLDQCTFFITASSGATVAVN
jgi:methyl coenzyme M reductase subunit C